jgi:hypothetical protein
MTSLHLSDPVERVLTALYQTQRFNVHHDSRHDDSRGREGGMEQTRQSLSLQ